MLLTRSIRSIRFARGPCRTRIRLYSRFEFYRLLQQFHHLCRQWREFMRTMSLPKSSALVSDTSSLGNAFAAVTAFMVSSDDYLYFTDNGVTSNIYRLKLTATWPVSAEQRRHSIPVLPAPFLPSLKIPGPIPSGFVRGIFLSAPTTFIFMKWIPPLLR